MPQLSPQTFADTAKRRAVLQALVAHPQWRLEDVCNEVAREDGVYGHALASITVGELIGSGTAEGGDDAIDLARLERARAANGPKFDAIVLEVIGAAGRPVGASYVRARVGGPRWKLQAAIIRLAEAGVIERSGATSGVRYRLPTGPQNHGSQS